MSEKSKYTESQWSRENESRNRNPDGCNDCGFFYIFLLHCALLLYLKKVNNVIAVCSKYVQVHTFWLNRMCVQSRQIRNWLQNTFLQRLESIQPAIVRWIFFCSSISFSNNNIDTKTYEIIFHLHFICNLLFKCQLKVITCFFFEWGWEFRIEPYINCGNFLSFVRRNADWWRLPSRIYPNLKVTWHLYFETEKTRSAMLSFEAAFIVYIYNFEDHASIAS